ncbi:hypothetical protein Z043_121686, partial [Scleropages formosus]
PYSVLLSLFLTLPRFSAHLLIILLQGCQVLPCLRELALLHALSHVPVDKGPLGIHQVKLVVQSGPGLSDSSGIAQHAHSPLHLGQVTTRNRSGGLTNLETSGAPIHKLYGTLCLYVGDGSIHILGHDVTTVQHAAGHVLSMAWVALHHLVGRLKAGTCDLCNRQLLVVGLLSRYDGKVDARVGHQVGLKFGEVHIQSSIEAQRGSDGGHNLADESVEGGVSGQDRVVGLHNSSGHLGSWIDGKLKFGLLAIVDREALHQQRESVKGIIPATNGLVTWHAAIRLDAMLQAVQLPACIANLHSGLAHVDGDALTLNKQPQKKKGEDRKK